MLAACGGERRKGFSGDTPDPGRRLCLLHLRFMPPAAASEERDFLGTPQTPAGGSASCTSASCCLRRRAKKGIFWGVPRPRQEAEPPAPPSYRFSTTNVATADPVPAETFNSASAERRERQPS